ncbi:NAD(P)-dependent dehydrogenase (short-subunit alcohol dehydrogenase family) [Scopulibacillus darangshiensis]|uniref:NAD(P)-dependent dehydrogenase (Short-subunit alcohol dehydrogenase family) n=1 Tax=Scopulibacillus darangshiensis TaxID=442528 RepID=A0A4R2NIX0_9BACL|nr:SDR family oxidoreductase [Scopulibacillus darangshiensis]TCP21054.1 NAD(P)-dependent dehydrogenase (short-subunit alcohol dehydrogenase family) [Scopulibacillus darangshiensis]
MKKSKPVVMITGASRGLGKALTISFAQNGYNLAICARHLEELNHVKENAKQYGADVLAITADVSILRDVDRFVSVTEDHFGRIDVLINNASAVGPSPIPYLLDFDDEDLTDVLRVNIMSAFLMSRRVLTGMLQQNEGRIINVTSEVGHIGYAGWGAYSVSKFAVEGLTQTWADELKETPIKMNLVDPGEMNTDMHALAVPDCDYPLKQPEEITDVFLHLASDQGKNVHGQRIDAEEFMEKGEAAWKPN